MSENHSGAPRRIEMKISEKEDRERAAFVTQRSRVLKDRGDKIGYTRLLLEVRSAQPR